MIRMEDVSERGRERRRVVRPLVALAAGTQSSGCAPTKRATAATDAANSGMMSSCRRRDLVRWQIHY